MLTPTLATLALLALPQNPAPVPPARIAWQRSLQDALAVQQRTGLPLLIAVNMDGEAFNDRFASTTYKDPAFIAATNGYVCVIASPNRHTERDYDALGNRVECPRLGGCTCSEHVNIEPDLFARYFGGKRNAPRHVGVSKDGKILFDRYLDNSMQTAVDAIHKHRGNAPALHLQPTDDLDELFTRHDAMARGLLERRYREGDEPIRVQLLERAATATNQPNDLLRMGLHDPNRRLVGLAALALAEVGGKDALIDIEDALARIDDRDLQSRLLRRLQELGRNDPAAARLAAHFTTEAARVAAPFGNEWQDAPWQQDRAGIEAELDRSEAALRQHPDDDALRLRLATAQAAYAMLLAVDADSTTEFWFADAARNAAKVRADALAAEAQAITAIAAWYRNDSAAAATAAAAAQQHVRSTRQPDAWLAGTFLDVLVQLTAQAAYGRAEGQSERNLGAEVARTRALLDLLAARGAGSERGLLTGIGLLEYAGLRAEAQQRLAALAVRLPASTAVHERWRNRLLVDLGAEGMRHRIANAVQSSPDRATAQWFAGFAALVAAERHTSDERRIEAGNAYDDAIERFIESAALNADYADTANHYAVLALAGRAWIRHLRGRDGDAVADLLRAAALRPASMDLDDGLQRKPRGIAGRLRAALVAAGKQELADRLAPVL